MFPPPHYCFGCGHDVELPPYEPQPKVNTITVIEGCGHQIAIAPSPVLGGQRTATVRSVQVCETGVAFSAKYEFV